MSSKIYKVMESKMWREMEEDDHIYAKPGETY